MPDLAPSFDAIAQDRRATLHHIPRGALDKVTRLFTRLLEEFMGTMTWRALHRLWCFPKVVLAAPAQGGKGTWARVGRLVCERCDSYMETPILTSWKAGLSEEQDDAKGPITRSRRRKAGADDEARFAQRIEQLVGHGALSKACAHLTSGLVQDVSEPRTWDQLLSLHPEEVEPG